MTQDTVILLVEDEVSDIAIFQRAYQKSKLSYPLIIATNGKEALSVLRGECSDRLPASKVLVVLDINLPKVNGFDFLHEIRTNESLKKHCVFVHSSSDNEADIARAFELGISGYLVKKTDFEETLNTMKFLDAYIQENQLPEWQLTA